MSVFQRMPADPLMHILLDGRPLDWYGLSATDGVLAIEAPDLAVAYQSAPGMAGSHDVTLDDPLGCAYPGLRRIALGVVTVGEDDEMMDARRRLGSLIGRSSTLSYRELPGQWRGRVTIKDWDERMLGPCRVDCATTIVMDAYPHIMGRAQRHALREGANLLHVTGNRPAWPVLTLTTSRAVSALSIKDGRGHTIGIRPAATLPAGTSVLVDCKAQTTRANGTLDAGMDATVTATRDAAGDTTLAFGLPRGAKGDPGDPGTPATATTLGVVKPGDNLTVRADGTLDASAGQYELPVASDTTLGGVKVSNSDYTNSRSFPVVTRNGEHLALSFKLGDNAMPDGIEFHGTENTTIGLKKATSTALGVVKPDGTTITADTDGTISAFTATASTLMGEGGATMGDALEVAPGIWLCIIRQWVITTQGGYYDAFSFSVYDRAGSRIALAASPTYGTQLQLRAGGNARTKTYNYDAITGKWVCTTTNTADTAQPDPCTLLLRAKH